MFRNPFIQKLLAATMVVLFAFSITPKQFLHDLVADHKDVIACQDDLSSHHIHSAGFYCACDNLVAESVFTDNNHSIELLIPTIFIEEKHAFTPNYHFIADFFSELRGPPAARI